MFQNKRVRLPILAALILFLALLACVPDVPLTLLGERVGPVY